VGFMFGLTLPRGSCNNPESGKVKNP